MAEQWDLDEEGVRRLGALTLEQPELVESLSLQGSYAGKIHSIGDAFRNFKNLRSLDLSRNLITSLKGIQYLCSLQDLNLYYNNIPSLVEVSRLQPLPFLKELDLRLNPVVRKDTDYRLFAVYTLQTLEKLDDRAVRESERKAAKLHFSQLGNSENFLLEVEKRKWQEGRSQVTITRKMPLSSDLGSLHGLPGNHSPPISARTSHVATVLRQLLELVDKHWNGSGSLLLNKKFLAFKIGPCAQPEFLAGPARDLLLTLVVPAPSQQWCHSHPEDTSKTFRRREMELKEAGHVVPNDMESLKQKLVRVLEENLILSEKIKQLEEGAATLIVSGHQSHTYDDLLRKNQQLNMQVACLNQELAQLKKLEETVALLHESQRSLVVTNEYLLQQLNKEQKGYSGKALLPPEKSHHLGRSSPFGKSTLSSSSPVAHDTGYGLGWSAPGSLTCFYFVAVPAVRVRWTEGRKNGPADAGDQAAPKLCSLPAPRRDCSPGGSAVLSPVSRSP
ncbi:leucine-rich repeat-containing protein 36 isoform X9 [Zalophus californianus]|uniref:Leucine-rich repeat-containing protein 36 isoform X9 n=1 Tax=Zalophus californianus TaxID=9704 RepID=A0A6J2F9D1_ZALCA|nr:leucine-rich repeat-containing protein 36 isoform X9 [Zalophus californianus]